MVDAFVATALVVVGFLVVVAFVVRRLVLDLGAMVDDFGVEVDGDDAARRLALRAAGVVFFAAALREVAAGVDAALLSRFAVVLGDAASTWDAAVFLLEAFTAALG